MCQVCNVVVVLATMLAGMPSAAMMLVKCTLPRHNNQPKQPNQANHSGPTKRKANQLDQWGQCGQHGQSGQKVRIKFEWICSGNVLGELDIWPGKPGTGRQVLDYLVEQADLVDPVLFAGHNLEQLVYQLDVMVDQLDDQLDKQLGKLVGHSVLVVTSGKLDQMVGQLDFLRRQQWSDRVCIAVSRLAERYWTQRVAAWTNQVLDAVLACGDDMHDRVNISWLATRAVVKLCDAGSVGRAARIYTRVDEHVGHDANQLVAAWCRGLRVMDDESMAKDMFIVLYYWTCWVWFSVEHIKAMVAGTLGQAAHKPQATKRLLHELCAPRNCVRYHGFRTEVIRRLACSGLPTMMALGDADIVCFTASFAHAYRWLGRILERPCDQPSGQPSNLMLVQFLLQHSTNDCWATLGYLIHYPDVFWDCFVKHGGVDAAASNIACQGVQTFMRQLTYWGKFEGNVPLLHQHTAKKLTDLALAYEQSAK